VEVACPGRDGAVSLQESSARSSLCVSVGNFAGTTNCPGTPWHCFLALQETPGFACTDHVTTLYPQKSALTSLIGGGRSVDIVPSWSKTTEFVSLFVGKPEKRAMKGFRGLSSRILEQPAKRRAGPSPCANQGCLLICGSRRCHYE
jgi:hypothetical protein